MKQGWPKAPYFCGLNMKDWLRFSRATAAQSRSIHIFRLQIINFCQTVIVIIPSQSSSPASCKYSFDHVPLLTVNLKTHQLISIISPSTPKSYYRTIPIHPNHHHEQHQI